ncbi:DoxX family protein [Novosphingobium piscinae]|uniref:DoxX family protein n=1 Tax=Novosphingobium piscinae TaxID=1507448 RepID=A0A7X1FXK5_9SPHN|nr:DoxX family protein [Novosphingobium piscinae]MBC2668845.1 DoxX family protein [Novosphingobium piscinae]
MAAFFAFVGYYKAFAPMAELVRHGAWTAHVPQWIGRPMGWTELVAAAALALAGLGGIGRPVRPFAAKAAVWLAASQCVSAWIHVAHGEASALTQNLFLFITLLVIAGLCRAPANRECLT